jgi:hypothetical protein
VSDSVTTLHERGRAAVLAGETTYDVPPGPSSPRWGLSVLVRPDPAAEDRLAEVTEELAAIAGPHHWRTGGHGASHLTVADVEPFREGLTPKDPLVRRCADGLVASVTGLPAARFRITGLVLAPGGVLARGEAADEASATLRDAVLAGLGDAASVDSSYRGDRWWTTLLHFTGPITDPAGLVDWVDARQDLDLGPFVADHVELVRYAFDGARTVPVPLATVALATSHVAD